MSRFEKYFLFAVVAFITLCFFWWGVLAVLFLFTFHIPSIHLYLKNLNDIELEILMLIQLLIIIFTFFSIVHFNIFKFTKNVLFTNKPIKPVKGLRKNSKRYPLLILVGMALAVFSQVFSITIYPKLVLSIGKIEYTSMAASAIEALFLLKYMSIF